MIIIFYSSFFHFIQTFPAEGPSTVEIFQPQFASTSNDSFHVPNLSSGLLLSGEPGIVKEFSHAGKVEGFCHKPKNFFK